MSKEVHSWTRIVIKIKGTEYAKYIFVHGTFKCR